MAQTHRFVTVYMPIALLERVEEICGAEGRTRSNFIKRCVEKIVHEYHADGLTLTSPHRSISLPSPADD